MFKCAKQLCDLSRIVSEYDQKILQSQTADKPTAPRGRAIQQPWGAHWLSGRVLDSRPRGLGFEPHRCHYVVHVVLEQDAF